MMRILRETAQLERMEENLRSKFTAMELIMACSSRLPLS